MKLFRNALFYIASIFIFISCEEPDNTSHFAGNWLYQSSYRNYNFLIGDNDTTGIAKISPINRNSFTISPDILSPIISNSLVLMVSPETGFKYKITGINSGVHNLNGKQYNCKAVSDGMALADRMEIKTIYISSQNNDTLGYTMTFLIKQD